MQIAGGAAALPLSDVAAIDVFVRAEHDPRKLPSESVLFAVHWNLDETASVPARSAPESFLFYLPSHLPPESRFSLTITNPSRIV